MTKLDFLMELTEKLSSLPWEELEDRWNYYSEMIDDRMEEGLTEEAAVAEMGAVDDIVAQIVTDIPLSRLIKAKIKPQKRPTPGTILLLVLGSPLWLPLLVAAFALILALYIALWAVIISLWAVFISLAACALGGLAGGAVFAFTGEGYAGFALIAAGLICAGLSIFLFFGCKSASRGAARLAKKITLGIKRLFIRKEKAA